MRLTLLFYLLILGIDNYCSAQHGNRKAAFDSSQLSLRNFISDTLQFPSISKLALPKGKRSLFKEAGAARSDRLKNRFEKPLTFNGGYVTYSNTYRSMSDTPFAQLNLSQHQITSSASFKINESFPIKINSLVSKSNSPFFPNIYDLQVELDLPTLQRQLHKKLANEIEKSAEAFVDSLSLHYSQLLSKDINELNGQFENQFSSQKFIEQNEILNVDAVSWDVSLPDSLAKLKSDSIKTEARQYISLYNDYQSKLVNLHRKSDSLYTIYQNSLEKVKQFQKMAKGRFNDRTHLSRVRKALQKEGENLIFSTKERILSGLRKFSLGRSPVNYTDLTARNISVKGINTEFNDGVYYFALAAGLIEYRYRDFILNNSRKPKQYFFLARAGLGSLANNFLIASFFKGEKKVVRYPSTNYTSAIVGLSMEAQYRFNKNAFVKAEVAQSLAPDFRMDPPKTNKWNLNDKTDKAFSVSTNLNIPASRTKIDASFKYSGANYQSFNNFQTNAALKTWNVKAEQYLFKNALRLNGAIRSNDFSNPYIVQNYQTNVVFKSLQAVFKKNKWPVFSIGYMPMTQLSRIGENIFENRFNSLSSNLFYSYQIIKVKITSMLSYSRFYNTSLDTGFIYFNARNFYASNVFHFGNYSTGLNITHSTNQNFRHTVIDENIKITINRIASLGIGFKVNNLNRKYTALGSYGSFTLSAFKNLSLSLTIDDGYIPSNNGTLINNTNLNFQLSKIF